MPRRRSRGRPAPREASRPAPARNPPPRPGMENNEIVPNQVHDSKQPIAPYDRVPTHCYHLSGDNEIRSTGGLKEFQIDSHLSRVILKDFQIGSIGSPSLKQNQIVVSRRRAIGVSTSAKSRYLPSYRCVYGRNKTFDMEERKTFISSGCNHLWQEKLFGITRVAVYGVDSICVVTRKKDLVQLENDYVPIVDIPFATKHETPLNALISEVKDFACAPGESRYRDAKRSQKPFGVVSVVTGTDNVHRASSDEFDEAKAIEFLREEMNSASTSFTFFKTVKTAICALQHLFRKKFKPNEIRVVVWKSVWESNTFSYDVDYSRNEMKIHDERSIKDILALTNKRHIAGSGVC